jgi:hypothetical protein
MTDEGSKKVQLPGKAIDVAGDDIAITTRRLLEELSLLGTDEEVEKAGQPLAAFTGPPQSVAVIEAGATSLAKWWAAGLGATATAWWGLVVKFWTDQKDEPNTQRVILLVAAVVSAALLIAIAQILSSDIRGRAAAAVATITGRATIGDTVLRLSQMAYEPESAEGDKQVFPLAGLLKVKYLVKKGSDEDGWRAVAISTGKDESLPQYLVVKGPSQHWAKASEVEFEA